MENNSVDAPAAAPESLESQIPGVDQGAIGETPSPEQTGGEKKSRVQQRFDALTARAKTAEEKASAMEAELARLKAEAQVNQRSGSPKGLDELAKEADDAKLQAWKREALGKLATGEVNYVDALTTIDREIMRREVDRAEKRVRGDMDAQDKFQNALSSVRERIRNEFGDAAVNPEAPLFKAAQAQFQAWAKERGASVQNDPEWRYHAFRSAWEKSKTGGKSLPAYINELEQARHRESMRGGVESGSASPPMSASPPRQKLSDPKAFLGMAERALKGR